MHPAPWCSLPTPCVARRSGRPPAPALPRRYIILAVLGGSGTLVVLYELIYGEAGKGLPCRRKEDENEEEEVQVRRQLAASKPRPGRCSCALTFG